MSLNIRIKPPAELSGSPFAFDQWYGLTITQVQFSLNHKINEYKMKGGNNTFMAEGFKHSSSSMSLTGVFTVSSDIPGATIENKKDNFIEAASSWWTFGDQRIRTKCAQIEWRGWTQYMMIERLVIMKSSGEEEEYEYDMNILIHEGK